METKFYLDLTPEEETVSEARVKVVDTGARVRMVENMFGTAGQTLHREERSLLAEVSHSEIYLCMVILVPVATLLQGFLVKRAAGRGKRRHFFLFTDILVWGSVLRENINCIR